MSLMLYGQFQFLMTSFSIHVTGMDMIYYLDGKSLAYPCWPMMNVKRVCSNDIKLAP